MTETIREGCTIIGMLQETERVRCNHCGRTSIKARTNHFDCPHCPNATL